MTVQKDKTQLLIAEETYTNDAIEGTDAINIFKRINAQEELIKDATCTGGSSRTYRGHDHVPGSSDTAARGIMRMCIGGFQLTRSNGESEPYTKYVYSGTEPESIAADASYTNIFVAKTWTGNATTNYKIGKVWVSGGIDSLRFDVCAEIGDTLEGAPQFRIKNLTDTNDTNTSVVATDWVDMDSTDPKWYGPGNEQKLTLKITKSTTIKEVDLDIEVRNKNDNSTNTPFIFYCALCYEYTDEKI